MSQNVKHVTVGEDAVMTIPAGEICWVARYGNIEAMRYTVASLLDSYAHLVSGEISTEEAVRRLRILRNEARAEHKEDGRG